MLYLLRSFGRRKRSALKVGYSGQFEKSRKSNYISHNPMCEFVSLREGGEENEKYIQLYLSLRGYKLSKFKEWFIDDPEVYQIFHYPISRIKRYLMNNKLRILEEINNYQYLTLFINPYPDVFGKTSNSKSIAKRQSLSKINSSIPNDINKIEELPYFDLRMEEMIEYIKTHPGDIDKLPDKYRVYFDNFSIQELEGGCLRKDTLDKKLITLNKNKTKEDPRIIEEVYKFFNEGDIYVNNEIRDILSKIYTIYNLKPKALDIKLYFETSRARVTNKLTKKVDEGYKLIKRKY